MITLSLYFIPKFFLNKFQKFHKYPIVKILTLLGIEWKKEKERMGMCLFEWNEQSERNES
jgi:hypothetical protein